MVVSICKRHGTPTGSVILVDRRGKTLKKHTRFLARVYRRQVIDTFNKPYDVVERPTLVVGEYVVLEVNARKFEIAKLTEVPVQDASRYGTRRAAKCKVQYLLVDIRDNIWKDPENVKVKVSVKYKNGTARPAYRKTGDPVIEEVGVPKIVTNSFPLWSGKLPWNLIRWICERYGVGVEDPYRVEKTIPQMAGI